MFRCSSNKILKIKEQAKRYHKYYDVIHYGDLYRLESPFENWDRCAWQFVSEDKKEALVIANEENYSKAVGKKGINIQLASRLTKYKLTIKKDSEVDFEVL